MGADSIWGMWPEDVLVRAPESLIKDEGKTGKDCVFRVEQGSSKRKKMECPVQRWENGRVS